MLSFTNLLLCYLTLHYIPNKINATRHLVPLYLEVMATEDFALSDS